MRALIIGLVLATILLAGCNILGGTPPANDTNDTVAPPPPPAKNPSFTIASPGDGETIMTSGDTSDASIVISTQNLLLKQPGGTAKKGEGHFKMTIDNDQTITFATKTYTIMGLATGAHTVSIELLNNDRKPYSPSISQTVSFTIEKEKPPVYEPMDYTVSVNDKGFDPKSLTVKVGDRVTWTNNGNMPQTATCFIAGKKVFDTGTMASGKSSTITMGEMFECEYYSQLFRALTGTIKVESNGTVTQ